MRHGGKILVEGLAEAGVERVFVVPGESFLAALDALHGEARIATIICRHEQGAAMMAEATGKLSGRPGVAMVTRAPGAANAMPGLIVAQEDETPMLLVVGLPRSTLEGCEAFQGIEPHRFFDGVAKAVYIVGRAERLAGALAEALVTSMAGRPGPVVLAIPEDILSAEAGPAPAITLGVPRPMPGQGDLDALSEKLAIAERPLMIVGGPGWSRDVQRDIEAFALRFDLPVAAAFRKQDYFDNLHRCYAGHLGFSVDSKLAAGVRSADLLLVVGARLGEITTQGYTLIRASSPFQEIVRVHPCATASIGGPRPQRSIVASMDGFAAALRSIEPRPDPPWRALRRDLRAAYESSPAPAESPGAVKLERVLATLAAALPPDAVVANGAGNYAAFVHRCIRYRQFGTCLAPGSGSMGYGLPAAIAARLSGVTSPVIAIAGDGCFMMTASELATAVQYGLPIIIIVADNGMYGTVRAHQERSFPGRVSGTTLVNPDFAAMAVSHGAAGETVARDSDFAPALERALGSSGPYLIQLRLDPEAIAPGETLASIRGIEAR